MEAIYPNAETADAIIMALSYCRAHNLEQSGRSTLPMWSSVAGKMIETVCPGISELRTTAEALRKSSSSCEHENIA